jgi:predicted ATPase
MVQPEHEFTIGACGQSLEVGYLLKTLEILGLRGFATTQQLDIAVPDGSLGSGLTILVGANNSGKSTVVEAFLALGQSGAPSFTQGRRNHRAGDMVKLTIHDTDGIRLTVESKMAGSSETDRRSTGYVDMKKVAILPSRRTFQPYFGKGNTKRSQYITRVVGFPAIRTSSINGFTGRLFAAHENRDEFDVVLSRILDPVPDWTIDQTDQGQYFLKFRVADSTHSSEGLGEGLVSLFFIIDALYDSSPDDTIIIDEPELSLHPFLQRKLSALFADYARDRQIILATHSPYFVDLEALGNGATVARTHLVNRGSQISQLTHDSSDRMAGLLRNYNNPHILGLRAQEVFFLADQIILVEGQEDVIFFEGVQDQIDELLDGEFFGWGVGGAGNMNCIASVLHDLGFSKVVGILDGNCAHLVGPLDDEFPDYQFFAIPADDVRTKRARQLPRIKGLLDENKQVRSEYLDETRRLFSEANEYLNS